jgi:L-asparaginase
MKRDENGSLTPARGYLTEQLREMTELKHADMPAYTCIENEVLLDSSDMGPDDWAKIVGYIEDNYYLYDGFIIIMGTDTMAYTASALSFMLENLAKTVVLTGSIFPFGEVYSDARRNLICSMIFACKYEIPEVCIFFNDRLLRGNRCRKVDSWGLAAFDSQNYPPLAKLEEVVYQTRHTLGLESNLVLPQPKGRFRTHKSIDSRVICIRLIPGFDDETLRSLINSKTCKAIILELYGTGNAPSRNKAGLIDVLKAVVATGAIVVVTSQCPRGAVRLDAYRLGRVLSEIGVVSAGDMTTESTAAKLAYLLGRGLSNAQVRRYMLTNLRGELTESEAAGAKL